MEIIIYFIIIVSAMIYLISHPSYLSSKWVRYFLAMLVVFMVIFGFLKFRDDLLMYAIKNEYMYLIKQAIFIGANVNLDNGRPLRYAIQHCQIDVVDILIKSKNIDPAVKEIYFNRTFLITLVDRSSCSDRRDIAKLLIEHGVDINAQDMKGNTALMYAIRDKNLTKFLIQNGANINMKNNNGETALIEAIMGDYDNIDTVRFLIDNGADVNQTTNDGETAMSYAVKKKDSLITQLLQDAGATSITELNYDKEFLASLDNIEKVREYLAKGARADAQNNKALFYAVSYKMFDLTKLLIEHGANVNARMQNSYNETILMDAVVAAREEDGNNVYQMIQLLIDKGADVNARDNMGNTPLLWAATGRTDLNIYTLLIQHGADINVRNNKGDTALKRAKIHNQQDTIELLTKYGARE